MERAVRTQAARSESGTIASEGSMIGAYEFDGPVPDLDRLTTAARQLLTVTPALSSTYRVADGKAQHQTRDTRPFALHVEHVPAESDLETFTLDILERETKHRFDLASDQPLMRITVVIADDQRFDVVLATDHTVCDGRSLDECVLQLSRAFATPGSLEPVDVSLSDYAALEETFMSSAAGENELEEWVDRLGGAVPETIFGDDRPWDSLSTQGTYTEWAISGEPLNDLRSAASKYRATPFMLLVSRLMGGVPEGMRPRPTSDGTSFMTPLPGRLRKAPTRLVGNFVNLVPVKLNQLTGNDDQADCQNVRDSLLWALTRQATPFAEIAKAVGDPEHAAMNRRQIFISGQREATLTLEGAEGVQRGAPSDFALFDISIWIVDSPKRIRLEVVHKNDLFSTPQLSQWLEPVAHRVA